MSYESCTLPGLFVLRWGPQPELADLLRYPVELAAERRRQGKPLIALFIMPVDSGVPDEVFRKAQASRLPAIMENLCYAVAVFEGTGFVSSLKRSALSSILLLSPRRHAIYVRSTVEEALVTKPPQLVPGVDGRAALEALRARGFCSAPAATAAEKHVVGSR